MKRDSKPEIKTQPMKIHWTISDEEKGLVNSTSLPILKFLVGMVFLVVKLHTTPNLQLRNTPCCLQSSCHLLPLLHCLLFYEAKQETCTTNMTLIL